MKKYKVTAKIAHAFSKADAMSELLDRYVTNNKHELAKRTSTEFTIQTQKAWNLIYEIYPKLKGHKITYNEDVNYKKAFIEKS